MSDHHSQPVDSKIAAPHTVADVSGTPAPYLQDRFAPTIADLLQEIGQAASYVFVDGQFLRGPMAALSVWDHGLLYGDGVFEGIRAYDGHVFKLDEHLDRLYASASALSLAIPLTKDELAAAICLTFRANGLDSGHARPIVTRGAGRPGLRSRRSVRPSIVIQAVSMPPTYHVDPIEVCVSSVRRRSSRSISSGIKCLNYGDSVLARIQANASGVDDAILLDLDGNVAEATAENVFIVKGGDVSTPTTSSALPGITRRAVIEHLRLGGVTVRERDITLNELVGADEVFLTGTASEMVAVGRVDGHAIADGRVGPVTTSMRVWYGHYVREDRSHPIAGTHSTAGASVL